MLGISAKEAIDQAYDDKRTSDEAREELVSFIVDIGIAAIPVAGSLHGAAAKSFVSNLFGNQSELVSRALTKVTGAIFKEGTTELTDAAKEAIVEALGEEAANIEASRIIADSLIHAILNGLTPLESSDIQWDIQHGSEILRNR
jgi:hypothetical protein